MSKEDLNITIINRIRKVTGTVVIIRENGNIFIVFSKNLPQKCRFYITTKYKSYKCCQAGFRSRPVLGRLRLLVKENIIFEFFKTDYELSKIHVLVPVHIGPNLGLL